MGFDFPSPSVPADEITLATGTRNFIFLVGEAQVLTLSGGPRTDSTYEIRDYWGTVVGSGSAAAATITTTLPPGWYAIYFRRASSIATWGFAQGRACFCVWRATAGMPPRAPISDPQSQNGFKSNIPTRSAALFGAARMLISDASAPATPAPDGTDLIQIHTDLAVEATYYKPFDTARPKPTFAAFVNGTQGATAGVQVAVNDLKTRGVTHYEGTNEPQIVGADGWLTQEQEFYAAVKGADPTAKVMGPCPVSIAGEAGSGDFAFIDRFFGIGGKACTDVISFHDYNGVNGDLTLARLVHERFLAMRIRHGIADRELWMTEVGQFANSYGVFKPRLQARWMMMSYLVWEQYGLPKEHTYYFYDNSAGFWSFPSFWNYETLVGTGSTTPLLTLMRVWSEELYGKTHARRLGFGERQDRHTVGSIFTADDGSSVGAFMSSGRTDHVLTLHVTGAASVITVSPVGVETTVPVVGGRISLPIDNGVATYVRLPAGATLQVIPERYGPDLLLGKAVTTSASVGDPQRLTNGTWETWYFEQTGSPLDGPVAPFTDTGTLPAWVEVDLGGSTTIDTVLVSCPPPWQLQGSLLDYDVQVWSGAAWVTLGTVNEPTLTFAHKTSALEGASAVESYYSDRCVFEHRFAPVATTKVRIYVRDCTVGGEPNAMAEAAGGSPGYHAICLRAIEAYNRSGLPAPKYAARIA